ncbi:MAG: hypothetical protein AAB427_16360, partial [Chloroflexota bacterium]
MPLPQLALLHGEDDFAIAERVTQIKTEMGDPSTASLNTAEFDGRTVTLPELRSACDTMPFLSERRLIIVRGLLTRLTGKPEDGEEGEEAASGSSQEFTDGLIEYIADLPPTSSLVLIESKALNERSRVLKAAAKASGAEIRKFDVPQGIELARWIMRRAKTVGGE